MNIDSERKSFFDPSTIGALVVVLIFWVGWSFFMEKKYSATSLPSPAISENQKPSMVLQTQTVSVSKGDEKEQILAFEFPNFSFQVSSVGFGFRDILIKSYLDREGHQIRVGDGSTGKTSILGSDDNLNFSVKKLSNTELEGEVEFGEYKILKHARISPDLFSVDITTKVYGPISKFSGLRVDFVDNFVNPIKSGLLAPKNRDDAGIFVLHNDQKVRKPLSEELYSEKYDAVDVFSFNGHYFSQALIDQSDIKPVVSVNKEKGGTSMFAHADYIMNNVNLDAIEFKNTMFFGPKEYDLLGKIDSRAQYIVDYGMFAWLAKPLLWLLKAFFSFFGNYGFAIVMLTLLVRTLVLPFNVYSTKSAKAMQAIQPELKEIREKYKDNAQVMNEKVLAVMKQNKVNPVGSCLPMLLQLPVFFALYQVLGQSIELYKAPFGLWIYDLSLPDPFFVLPVLMGAVMFVQQKITPTAMEPAQAKIMLALPVIFSFFMLSLPSGLTLYMFISGLFGVVQQLILMRDSAQST